MKKIALILAVTMTLSLFAGCGSKTTLTAPKGSTEELIGKIYENVTVNLDLITIAVDIQDPDALAYYTGLSGAEGVQEITVSEPVISVQAYSLVLVRLKDARQAETIAQTMFDNIDMRKWISVEATEKQAVVCGDLVMLVMLNPEYGTTTDQIVEAFTKVCGGTVGTVIQ